MRPRTVVRGPLADLTVEEMADLARATKRQMTTVDNWRRGQPCDPRLARTIASTLHELEPKRWPDADGLAFQLIEMKRTPRRRTR